MILIRQDLQVSSCVLIEKKMVLWIAFVRMLYIVIAILRSIRDRKSKSVNTSFTHSEDSNLEEQHNQIKSPDAIAASFWMTMSMTRQLCYSISCKNKPERRNKTKFLLRSLQLVRKTPISQTIIAHSAHCTSVSPVSDKQLKLNTTISLFIKRYSNKR